MKTAKRLQRPLAISMIAAVVFTLLVELPAAAATPNAPTSVLTSWTNSSTAKVTWTAPSPPGATITGYTVTSSPGGFTCTVAAPSTLCSVPGLTPSTSYTFSVFASSAGGDGPSASSTASTSPSRATTTTTLTASPTGTQNVGTVVDLSATVTTGATGTVAFFNYSTAISGCGTVVVNAGYAGCSTSGLPSGTASLSAVYSGDANNAPSTSSTVSYLISTTTLAAPSSPLVITTIDAPINASTLQRTLATSGGDGGAISYTVTNGTASGCSISSNVISVPTNVSGTCLVIATEASTSSHLGESSNVTPFNFFWQYAGAWTSYVSSYSCPSGGTATYNGSSWVCTIAATQSCPPGATLSGTNCVSVSYTVYNTACVNSLTLGTAVWSYLSYNAPYYGYCTWTIAVTYSCSVGTLSGTSCIYLATPNYSYYWACPLGGTASGSICSLAGGSGPNVRGPEHKIRLQSLTTLRTTSLKGPS